LAGAVVPWVPVKHALRKLREREGWTIQDLVDKTGLSDTGLKNLESRNPPTFVRPDNASRISEAFGLNLKKHQDWKAQERWVLWVPHAKQSEDVESTELHIHQVSTLARLAKQERDLGLHDVTLQTSAGSIDLLGQYRQHKVFTTPKLFDRHVFAVKGKVDHHQTLSSSTAKKIGAAVDEGAVFRLSRMVAKKLPQYVSVFTLNAATTTQMMKAYDDEAWLTLIVHVHYDPPAGPWRGFFFIEADGQKSKKFCFVVEKIVTEIE
jgi:transcriptional regulator with XRE-family HTH domain